MVLISVAMEHGIHSLGKWFQKRQKKAMNEALEKIKAELMLLGFISLLLTIGQVPISKICIPVKVANTFLPCKDEIVSVSKDDSHDRRRKLLWVQDQHYFHRMLATSSTTNYCSRFHDKVALISQSGIHQLHIFIFVLTVFHILYSVLTMALGQAKMRKWKSWESETSSLEYQFSNDPSRFRFTHQTSFVKRHLGLSSTPGVRWIVAFFRQFFGSVSKVDYLTMRHGFINAHLAPNSKFNFHKYIKRSLEDDFKIVVGVSLPLWFIAIIILLLDVYGYYTLVWVAFLPLIVLLVVGMKLEIVIMEMAQQIQNRTTVIRGVPIVEPSNKYFWFNRPQWVLFLIHLTLFENAFQLAHFLWIWYTFGIKTCFHDNLTLTVVKVVLGVALQFLCSYITFPLYALVTQMGSHMKKTIFEEQTAKALIKWRQAAKERKKQRNNIASIDTTHSGYLSGENTPSRGSSPIHLLHKYNNNNTYNKSSSSTPSSPAPAPDVESLPNSPGFYPSDCEIFEMEEPSFASDFEPNRQPSRKSENDVHVSNAEFTFFSP
ncbi:mlo protein [Dioscorea alata]|uniref:Mlo protein n=1 Tax=Dioscorea alata TaxID=55571 RepID=A0ACB7UV48_DIOAL|nr:mlo protein [Dioscorea alata]